MKIHNIEGYTLTLGDIGYLADKDLLSTDTPLQKPILGLRT